MKKKLLLSFIVVATAIITSGCGSSGEPAGAAPGPAPESDVTTAPTESKGDLAAPQGEGAKEVTGGRVGR